MSKIIRPEGMDLINALNSGEAICNNCGAIMDRKEDPRGGCDIYVCPACGWEVDEMDYEYESSDPEGVEWAPNVRSMFENDVPPEGCRACGGPYPHCKDSCKMFDD